VLTKQGQRLVVEKQGRQIHWVHAFKVEQVVLLGSVSLTPKALAFLLQEGIDTVFLSFYGKYRGRLMTEFGKNIELRRRQFHRMGEANFQLPLARSLVRGKLLNCRLLLRRANQERRSETVTRTVHRLRLLAEQTRSAANTEVLMGLEGAGAAAYFGVLGEILKAPGITFAGRNRRPPKDPVNVLLSLGYTLLANAVQTQVHLTGLDPYLGCLHSVEYGRPSLVLDLMEEFRPVLVDSLVISLINKRIIRSLDFFRPEDREPAAFDFADTDNPKEGYPILLTHQGMKKFITAFEGRLNQKVLYLPQAQRLSYRQIILAQVRRLVRTLEGEEEYEPFMSR
jgi:CRISPR-associated protein Cas1